MESPHSTTSLTPSRGFGSDNHSGVHPRYLAAIARVNDGHMPSYGTDQICQETDAVFRNHFGPCARAHYVFNGTAANVLALKHLTLSHQAILSSENSHIFNDECGAPEKAIGCKMIPVKGVGAKISPADLKPHLIRRGDQHCSQVRVVSITQPTELGQLYTVQEVKDLGAFARENGLKLHMDGSRFVNAIERLRCTFSEMTTEAGVDVLSLGGTKNGLLFGEAVVFLRPGLDEDFKYTRKQLMQLPSKTRYLAAQFRELLGTELWRENAAHANQMAKVLSEGLQRSTYAQVTQPTEVNAVFARFPKSMVSELRKQAFFYVWDETTFECRLMTSWDTELDEINAFLQKLEILGQSQKETFPKLSGSF